eukprot:evm.model.scf_1049EXC.1 EVM.evm.TU.scf_1049EXC.1   scf_1049EXC:9030-10199(+)
MDSGWYSSTFYGDGTYYGPSNWGACVLRDPVPSYYSGMMPVAMNVAQFEDSASCGTCLQVWGSGNGAGANPITGSFMAFVSDNCPGCKWGDIDLSTNGDGRWDVQWTAVPCPDSQISFKFEGSHQWYLKVQPRGMKSPAVKVTIDGQWAKHSTDNFFEVWNGGGFNFPVPITVETVLGCTYSAYLNGHSGEEYPPGLYNYDCSGVAKEHTSGSPQPPPPPVPGKCAAVWEQCGGATWQGAKCCSEGVCSEVSYDFWHCAPSGEQQRTKEDAAGRAADGDKGAECAGPWGQCGGTHWKGTTCCREGECTEVNKSYWHCAATKGASKVAKNEAEGKADGELEALKEGRGEVSGDGCAPLWGQCGGTYWQGPKCCSEGDCIWIDDTFWKCQK